MPMGAFHVTITWSRSDGLRYYENGNLIDHAPSGLTSEIPVTSDPAVTIGYQKETPGGMYSSLVIDDVVIFKRIINNDEVPLFFRASKY